jgi:hypothetical protein
MQKLIQLVYISRATFVPSEISSGIQPNVARILLKSRVNNEKNGLVGVLYFGDNNFFQCLEGEESAVEQLYAKLMLDPRHKDLKIIIKKSIDALSFKNWSMKHVPLESKMTSMLQAKGFKKFDPYKFSDEMNNAVVELLHEVKYSSDEVAAESYTLVANASDSNVMQRKPDYLILGVVVAFIILAVVILLIKI